MARERASRLGILETVLEGTGTCVGTVAAIGIKTKNFLVRPVDDFAFDTDKQSEATPKTDK